MCVLLVETLSVTLKGDSCSIHKPNNYSCVTTGVSGRHINGLHNNTIQSLAATNRRIQCQPQSNSHRRPKNNKHELLELIFLGHGY